MPNLTEKSFYIILISILTFSAIFIPIIIIQANGNSGTYVFIRPYYENTTTPSEEAKKHLEEYVDNYYKLKELYNYLETFVRYRRILFSKKKLGLTPDNNAVYNILMKKPSSCNPDKPQVLVVSGLVGSDWGSVLTTIEIMNKFYLNVHTTNKILNNYDFNFFPLVDPDGYNFSMTLPIYSNWQKSSSDEISIFRDYFKKNSDKIKIGFFLSSLSVHDYEKFYYSIPEKFVGNSEVKIKRVLSLKENISEYNQQLVFTNMTPTGVVDKWLIDSNVAVINFLANFKARGPESLHSKIKEMGADAYFLITTLLNGLKLVL